MAISPAVTFIYKGLLKSIKVAGVYSLTEDYDGVLEITADNVNLNLDGFTCNLSVKSAKNIRVSNGISKSTVIKSAENVSINTLRMFGQMSVTDSINITLDRLSFNGVKSAFVANNVKTLNLSNFSFSKCKTALEIVKVQTFILSGFIGLDPAYGYNMVSCQDCDDCKMVHCNGIGQTTLTDINKITISQVKSDVFQLMLNKCLAGVIEQIISSNLKTNWVYMSGCNSIMLLNSTGCFESENESTAITLDSECSNCFVKGMIIDGHTLVLR